MQNKEIEKQFFGKFKNSGYDVFKEYAYKKLSRLFYSLTNSKQGEKIIEFGCGTGAFTKYLTSYHLDITGIDISKDCVDYARRNIKDVNFIVGDVEETGFKNQSFDIIVASGVLHHFPDFSKVVTEALRILKVGGRFFAYEPNIKNPAMWLYRNKKSPFYSNKGITAQESPLNEKGIKDVFSKCGFHCVEVFAISGITYKHVDGKIASKLLRIYNIWEKFFEKIYLSKYYGSFLIISGKK